MVLSGLEPLQLVGSWLAHALVGSLVGFVDVHGILFAVVRIRILGVAVYEPLGVYESLLVLL